MNDHDEKKEKMKKLRTGLVLLCLSAAILMPAVFSCFRFIKPLSGVTGTADLSQITAGGFMDGSAQNLLNAYVTENLPGRAPMIRLRNQLIFSLFDKSTNSNMLLGVDKYIFEKSFLYRYENIDKPTDEKTVRASFDCMKVFRDKLKENGTELFVFITPSKPRYCEEKIEDKYKQLGYYKGEKGNYELLKEVLSDYDFHVFDGIEYVDKQRKEGGQAATYPLFQPTGTHWTWTLGLDTALAFKDYMQSVGDYHFPKGHQVIFPSEEPVFPDADIYDSMNILRKPAGNYFVSDIWLDEDIPDEEKPNVLMRGCSFMGQSIATLISSGYFHQDVYMENTLHMSERMTEASNFSSYDEVEIGEELKRSDIVIIEINEAHTYNIGMGMMEYVIEHPECLE